MQKVLYQQTKGVFMDNDKVICVVPAYNEGDVINSTIEKIEKIESIDEIVIVNDGSTDNTLEEINKLGKQVISYDKNMGKGYAIKKAIENLNYGYLVLIDGDLGETSSEIDKLIAPVLNNEADFTIARFPEARTVTNKKGGLGLVKGLAKNGIEFFTGKEIYTSLSGQRVYKKSVLDTMEYIPDRYGIEVAMTVQALNNNFSLLEVPVQMSHRYTERNLSGFIHRGKQFKDILKTFIVMYFKGYKKKG